jgi:hypothetical protein
VDYVYDFNHPKDDTIGGSSEVFRSDEVHVTWQVQQPAGTWGTNPLASQRIDFDYFKQLWSWR